MSNARSIRLTLILPIFLVTLGITSYRSLASNADGRSLYITQPGTPVWTENFVKNNLACRFSGIAGLVFDQFGQPVSGLIVRVTGTLGGKPVNLFAVTGSESKLGPSGYLIQLSDAPIQSAGSLTLKLISLTGTPLSANIQVNTSGECKKNLSIVNLSEINIENPIFLPVIRK